MVVRAGHGQIRDGDFMPHCGCEVVVIAKTENKEEPLPFDV
jgi:hypothetical protein